LWLLLGFGSGCERNRSRLGTGHIVILHTNAHRGHAEAFYDSAIGKFRGGLPARATLIDEIRRQVGSRAVLLADSGDLIPGTDLDRVTRGAPDILAMNAMGYDAVVVGPKDFAYGLQNLRNLSEGPDVLDITGASLFPMGGGDAFDFSRGAKFPFLGTNLIDSSTGKAPSGFAGGPVLLRIGTIRIGLFGITTVDASLLGRPPSNFNFRDPVQAGTDAIAQLQGKADIFVAITRQTDSRDATLLKQLHDLDVIIGGAEKDASGIFTRDATLVGGAVPPGLPLGVDNPNGVFVRAGSLGRELGRLDLIIVRGTVIRADATTIPIVDITEKPDVSDILQPFLQKRDSAQSLYFNTVIGQTSVKLYGDVNDVTSVRAVETNWGDYVADKIRAKSGASAVFVNAGVFRSSIDAGDITEVLVFDALPTNEVIATLALDGSQILDVLEHAVEEVPSEAFLQVSGITFTWDASATPGNRIDASSVAIGGASIVLTQTYTVAVNESIARGGDGYAPLSGAAGVVFTQDFIAHVVIDAILAETPINPAIAGRIIRKN
jgi:2',3'-cyclic-nucleotide 2'-phosphodiesterase (5'-nucleotidase family)